MNYLWLSSRNFNRNNSKASILIIKNIDISKGSYNRLWLVLGALASKGGNATLSEITRLSGLPRSSAEDILIKVINGQIPELILQREKATFIVKKWGIFLPEKNLLEFYRKHCGNG